MWPFWTTLSAILFSIFSTLKPGVVLFSTMKPLTWLSATSRAQMIETSHHGALPIHRFSPLRIQVSPSRFAVVSQAAGGAGTHQRLGEAEAADLLEARHRRQPLLLLLFRSVDVDGAHRQADVHAHERRERRVDAGNLHLDKAQQRQASARRSRSPALPSPPMPNSFTAGSSSKGNASSTQYFVMTGATLVSMNARTRFTVASSSALKVS